MKIVGCDYAKRSITFEFKLDDFADLEFLICEGISSKCFDLAHATSLGEGQSIYRPIKVGLELLTKMGPAFKIACQGPLSKVDHDQS